ncbi:MAG: arylsulfatase A-like enzyme [Candidatus Pelagisphaera sp.]|jgi:arylsulfatase A-like enzyme
MRTHFSSWLLNRSLGLSLLSFLCLETTSLLAADLDRPNVLLILTDNQSYFELSCHGHEQVQTPRIDKLAGESVDLVNFHAPPFCSPSRTLLMTGRYAMRAGVHTTVQGVSIMHKDEITMANYLGGVGYRTAIFGKWHLGYSYPYHPMERGFDETFVHGGGGIGQLEDYYGNDHLDAVWDHNGVFEKSEGFSSDVLFDRATQFIDANREDPFFCFISTPATHTPYQAEPRAMARIKARGVEASDADLKLYSMIENIDENVGNLMDQLDVWNLRDNTIVIFATDQGIGTRGDPNPLFEGKRETHGGAYDEKNQVFCMVRYPPLTKAGENDAITGMVDVLPTILDLCDVPIPSSLDGRSLRSLLAGADRWEDDRTLIVQCPRNRYREEWQNAAVKTQRWRLVGGDMLFDIEKDPSQLVNLAGANPDVVAQLQASYKSFWISLPPAADLLSRHILGDPRAPEVRLNGMDWYRGGSPWHQAHLTRAHQNGVWAVDVARDGRYRLELRWYPREESTAIGAIAASVRVGDRYAQAAMSPEDPEAVFELELEAGEFDLETAFQLPETREDHDQSWGAYFVHVEYLGE